MAECLTERYKHNNNAHYNSHIILCLQEKISSEDILSYTFV